MAAKIVKAVWILLLTGLVVCFMAFIGAAFYIDHMLSKTDSKNTAYLSVV